MKKKKKRTEKEEEEQEREREGEERQGGSWGTWDEGKREKRREEEV